MSKRNEAVRSGGLDMSRRWLRTLDAAEHLKLKPATLINYRHRKVGPRYAKLGSVVVYDVADLDAWVITLCI